jgi:hypothetical protein
MGKRARLVKLVARGADLTTESASFSLGATDYAFFLQCEAHSFLDEPQFSSYTRCRLTVQGVDDDLLLFTLSHDYALP